MVCNETYLALGRSFFMPVRRLCTGPGWYRTRLLVTRLWNRWSKLTLEQRRKDLDGTNNSCERLIGWWIKERYRTMRGYKRSKSVKNVVFLTARMGVRSGQYDMTELYA